VLAVDYGERRVGLAISDPTGTIPTPLPVLRRRRGQRPPVAAIGAIAKERGARALVIGLPLTLDGGESEWTREVRRFGERLSRRTGLALYWVDERLTSVEAERAVRASGLPRAKREQKDRIDTAAAMIILQRFLTERSGG
jgi:putative Holliday junction resolvase